MKYDEVMGKFHKIKEMKSMKTNIQTFHANHYGTTINKLYLHLPYVNILGTNNFEKKETNILKEA